MGQQVADVLAGKARAGILSIDADATVYQAVARMVEANVGSLLVTEQGHITGIVTERDYLRRVALEGRTDHDTRVGEIMTEPLIVVGPDTSIDECRALMTERRIRHLPVADDGEIVGVISIGDVVKFQTEQQGFQLRYLNEYISAR